MLKRCLDTVTRSKVRKNRLHSFKRYLLGRTSFKIIPDNRQMGPKVEVLNAPVKSYSDKKEYKVIRLENGLTACLISDIPNLKPLNELLESESSESEVSDDEAGSEYSTASSGGEETEEEVDGGKMKRAMEAEEKLAAAALCVGVGSFSDPKSVPGMAHFLEHMVFMGSEKFPQENDFDSFIKKRGGSDNASTDCETTVFYFECLEKHMSRALDKFAQFFISPLMKREAMTREREAIESEFQMAIPDDSHRRDQLLSNFYSKDVPINSFFWGNLITLKDSVDEDELYRGVHEFRKRHYSAHRMTLAIQARLPMEVLETYVTDYFSAIPNNLLPPDDFKPYAEKLFNIEEFNKLYYIKPVTEICQIDLTWVVPSLLDKYRYKPLQYVSWLFGHEEKGSLLSYLKEKVWALSITTGNSESGFEYNTMYTLFAVNITLTDSGLKHIDEVIEAVFSYVNFLRMVGPQERIFKEIQTLEEISFRYQEEETASDFVEDLVENMHFYPPEDYITGPDLFFEYNPKTIKDFIESLKPENVNIMVSHKATDTVFDREEPWFKTSYTVKDISLSTKNEWKNIDPFLQFRLPEPNIYISTNFDIINFENVGEYPEKVVDTPVLELWYKPDVKFQLPEASMYYHLITPVLNDSAINSCLLDLYGSIMILQLTEEAYSARLAELEYVIRAAERGIVIKLQGYNEKLPLLLHLIATYMRKSMNLCTEELFNAVKTKLSQAYCNAFLKPSKLAEDVRLSILMQTFWSPMDKHKALSQITFNMLREFVDGFLSNLYVQVLVQGNILRETAIEESMKFIETLGCKPLSPDLLPQIRVRQIPLGEHCCRVMSFNHNDSNSIITNYYQSGPASIKNTVIIEIIMLLMEEPLFDELRTKEQLGYHVYNDIRDTYGIIGYSITVNAQATKNSTEHVDVRIEEFVKRTIKTFKKMTDKELNQSKLDLIKLKQCIDVHLKDEVDRNWTEIVSREYIFDRKQREIEAIKEIKCNDVRQWLEDHSVVGNKTNFRKLTIQVVGHNTAKKSESKNVLKLIRCRSRSSSGDRVKNEVDVVRSSYSLKYIDHSPDKTGKTRRGKRKSPKNESPGSVPVPNNYFIMNVNDFRENLFVYPETKCVL